MQFPFSWTSWALCLLTDPWIHRLLYRAIYVPVYLRFRSKQWPIRNTNTSLDLGAGTRGMFLSLWWISLGGIRQTSGAGQCLPYCFLICFFCFFCTLWSRPLLWQQSKLKQKEANCGTAGWRSGDSSKNSGSAEPHLGIITENGLPAFWWQMKEVKGCNWIQENQIRPPCHVKEMSFFFFPSPSWVNLTEAIITRLV